MAISVRKAGMLFTSAMLSKSATSVARKNSFLASSFAASPAAGRTSLNWRGFPASAYSLRQIDDEDPQTVSAFAHWVQRLRAELGEHAVLEDQGL